LLAHPTTSFHTRDLKEDQLVWRREIKERRDKRREKERDRGKQGNRRGGYTYLLEMGTLPSFFF